MITLKSDSRSLTYNAKFSYLTDNYVSGVGTLIVVNGTAFAVNDYVLLGEFGSETSEIRKISSVTTNTLGIDTTLFSHSQDTKVTILKYNQVRFYHTTTATFSATSPIAAYMDIDATSFHTKIYDTTNTTGFGWFVFYNATTLKATTASNAIPYAGFDESSVKEIFDTFFSLLNNKELKLIDNEDAFKWLNEAYAIAKNELNLVNQEYNVPVEWSFTTISGTAEYDLEDNFSDLVSITDSEGRDINFIELQNINYYNENGSTAKYFLRSDKIGISPVPTSVETYSVYYKSKSTELTSYYDSIDLPDNNFYPLVDHMMYRASQKLTRPNPEKHEQTFTNGLNRMKITSVKQSANLDGWSVDRKANI